MIIMTIDTEDTKDTVASSKISEVSSSKFANVSEDILDFLLSEDSR